MDSAFVRNHLRLGPVSGMSTQGSNLDDPVASFIIRRLGSTGKCTGSIDTEASEALVRIPILAMCKGAIRRTSYQSPCSPQPSGSVIRSYIRMMDIARFVTALTIHSVDSDDRQISTRRRQRDLQNGHRAAPQKPQWAVALWAGRLISIIDQLIGTTAELAHHR